MLKKTFNQMAAAQIISGIAAVLCLLIDSIMIGKYLGVEAMAAYGLSNPVLLSFVAIASMISAGVQVMCSKSLGSGDKNATNTIYSVTVAVSVVIGVVGLVLVVVLRGALSQLLGAGAEGSLHDLTSDYLLGFIIGVPAVMIVTVLIPFLQLSGKQSVLVVAVIALSISDVVGDILNVFVFRGGMLGMGISSSISYYVALLIGLVYFAGKSCIFKFSPGQVSLGKCIELLKAGIPTIINMVSLVFLSFTLNRILISIADSEAVAAFSVISTSSNICYSFSSGLGAVTLMLAGMYYYEDDRNTLMDLFKLMIREELCVNALIPLVVFFVSPYLAGLFLDRGTSAFEMAAFGLKLFAISLIPSAINTGLKNFYQGTLHIRLTELISVLQNFSCIALFALILGNIMGINGVWISYLCGELLTFIIICAIVFIRRKRVKVNAETFSLIPDDFGVPNECFLRDSISSLEEVNSFSVRAYDFCKANNAGEKCSYYTSLCIEELCNNIVTYGFDEKKKKTPDINVSLFYRYPDMKIRIRDNSSEFNPVEYAKLLEDGDMSAHIGIRMVLKLASDAKYTNSMSQNCLTLTVKASDF